MFLLVSAAQAVTFRASIDESKWVLESSKFECKLSQQIPAFGIGEFLHEAGVEPLFTLKPTQRLAIKRNATLVVEASPWQPGVATSVIGPLEAGRVLKTNAAYAGQMLVSLYKGMSPTFTVDRWMNSDDQLRVALSAANFKAAYKDYISCVAGLLPANYRQVARTAVLFPPAAWTLSDATRERLELIAFYVQEDKSVTAIYIDGHSDSGGRRLLNRDLSKQRAEEVTRYLISLGVEESMVTTRYHGERYPVVPNTSKTNRARNRRVTIRLDRE
ncbi:MAG: sodium-type flagellar protein MotY, putative [Osedax symbiont Rs2]|nr:MAG: sodium-type flagellar protein MotY, putative [Osedax symbiont Rs2]